MTPVGLDANRGGLTISVSESQRYNTPGDTFSIRVRFSRRKFPKREFRCSVGRAFRCVSTFIGFVFSRFLLPSERITSGCPPSAGVACAPYARARPVFLADRS